MGLIRVVSTNVHSYRNGPQYVRDLAADVAAFEALLEWAERLTQDARVAASIPTASVRMIVDRAEQRMLELRRRLERVMRSSEGDIYRVKWLRSESTCRDLQGKLKDCYLEINTMVNLVSTYAATSPSCRHYLGNVLMSP